MDCTALGVLQTRILEWVSLSLLQGIFPAQGSNPGLPLKQVLKNLGPGSNIQRFPRWLRGKESACQCRRCKRRRFNPWVGKIPWRRKWQPIPVFWTGELHGQRRLEGYSWWYYKELDTTEHTHTHSDIQTGLKGKNWNLEDLFQQVLIQSFTSDKSLPATSKNRRLPGLL